MYLQACGFHIRLSVAAVDGQTSAEETGSSKFLQCAMTGQIIPTFR